MVLMRRACLSLVLILDALSAQAQVGSTSILTCSADSISIDISSTPGFRFAPAKSLPRFGEDLIEEKAFVFDKGPFRSASIYLASHGPEGAQWGRGVGAPFQVWVETVARTLESPTPGHQIWRLLEDDRSASYDRPHLSYTPSHSDKFEDLMTLTGVTADRLTAVELSFAEDLSGGTASNEARRSILFDFGSAPPSVRAGVVCASSTGGGICGGLDAMEALHAEQTCEWVATSRDLRCRQIRREPLAQRSFLLSDPKALLARENEYATVADAVQSLRQHPKSDTAVVAGLGALSVISRAGSFSKDSTLLGSADSIFLAPVRETETVRQVFIKTLPDDRASESYGAGEEERFSEAAAWTPETTLSFTSRLLHSAKDLSVLEVVTTEDSTTRSVLWVGIESRTGITVFDAIEIATERRTYEQCGWYVGPPTVIGVGTIRDPFQVAVRIQPHNVAHLQDPSDRGWGTPVADCTRSGEIRWQSGKGFESLIEAPTCRASTTPSFVHIDELGAVTLSDTENEGGRRAQGSRRPRR